jgi:basic amino acid/polyamine antiporter, APA family
MTRSVRPSVTMSVLRTKPVEQSLADTEDPDRRLRRSLGAMDLTVLGIGIIIGSGIFVLTGQQAALNAGPAVAISFVLAAVISALAGLAYAELASTVPVAGSAYTYSYATLGEIFAWIIGWDLILEFGLGAAVVARGWSAYLQSLFGLPTSVFGDHAVVDVGAVFIVGVLAAVAVAGVKQSSRLAGAFVAIKVAVCLFVIVAGLFFVKAANYHPFVPAAKPAGATSAGLQQPILQALMGHAPSQFGLSGILAAASIVFFSYTGFEAISTVAEETRNPQRDLPRGILGALAVCTVLYVAVALVVTGMVHYTRLDSASPLADAFTAVGAGWAGKLVSLGAVAGISSVVLVDLLTQTRLGFAMSRDGLLPRGISKTHPRFGTPHRLTLISAGFVAVLAAFFPLKTLSEMVSIGTLFAFVLVSIGVVVLRRKRPDLPRSFRVPWMPMLPVLAVLGCVYLMLNLSVATWLRFVVWLAIGMAVYLGYGRRHSRLRTDEEDAGQAPRRSAPVG